MGLLGKSDKSDSDSDETDQLLYQPANSLLSPLPAFIGFRQDCVSEKQSELCFEQHIWRGKEVSPLLFCDIRCP